MPLTKLQFRPGINREITSYSNEGGWFDCDKIRFQQGFPEQLGGWQRKSNNPFLGTCRTLHPWVALNRDSYLGVGTNLKYYIEFGGDYYDITPLRATATLTNPFVATDGSETLLVNDVAHGAVLGDFVTFSGATGLGGNVSASVLNQEYQISAIVDADSYEVTMSVTANATDDSGSPGGGTVTAAYQINVGLDTTVTGTGWGTDTWGSGAWGEASSAPVVTSTLRLWGTDNFGEDLLYNVRDGGIYYWDASAASPLNQRGVTLSSLPGANTTPTIAKQVLVSDRDRHIIAFGCDDEFSIGTQDPMLIRFSSQESLTDWASTATNTAGSLRLSSGSEIVTAIETRQQVLVFTDTTLYAMQFLGPPFTFGVNTLSEGITIQSPGAAAAVQDRVFWMGKNEFYVYTGAVERLPCTVRTFVFDELDQTQAEKVVAGVNSSFGEVWWFYPSVGSGGVVDRYVVYNYEGGTWYFGNLARTAWLDRGVNAFPIAAGRDGYLYEHENGLNDGSVSPSRAIEGYIQSSPLDIGEGDQFAFITRMIPDVGFRNSTASIPQVQLTLSVRNFSDGTYFDSTTQDFVKTQSAPVDQRTEQLFFRLRGRQMSFRIASDERNVTWRLGSPRVDMRTDGRR
jgi:hypothetical protein